MVYQSLHRAFAGFLILLLAATTAQAQNGATPPGATRPPVGAQPGVGAPPAGGVPNGAAPAAVAHAAPRPAAGHHAMGGVALIDLGYILKNHAGFNQRMEEFRQQWEGREHDIKGKQDALRQMAMKLNDYGKGSKEYKQLEEEVAKRNAELQLEVGLAKKKFNEAEAKLFYDAYRQVYGEVRLYCEQNNIVMVYKFNGEAPNPDNPDEVNTEMFNKPVLYYNPGVDITPLILERMKSAPLAGSGPAPGPRPAPNTRTADRTGVPQQRTQ